MAEVLLTLIVRQDDKARPSEDKGPSDPDKPALTDPSGKMTRVQFWGKNETRIFDVNTSVLPDSTGNLKGTKLPNLPRVSTTHDPTLVPSHGKQAKKQKIQVEFMKVNTIGKAFQKWSQVMTLLRKTDRLLMIQNVQDPTRYISLHHLILLAGAAE